MTAATANGKPNRKQLKRLRAQSRIAYRKAKREARQRGYDGLRVESEQQRKLRKTFDRLVRVAVAERMCQRFYRDGPPDPICLDYRYWQARRCGWDALAKDSTGLWPWWIGLHYSRREMMVNMSGYRLLRGQETASRGQMQAYLLMR